MGLQTNVLNEPITSLDLRPLIALKGSATVGEAIRQMRRRRVGGAIIVDDAGKPLGMFNEKLVTRLLANDDAALMDPVDQHMSKNIMTVRQTDRIVKLIQIMKEHQVRWVCVTDSEGRAVALSGMRGLIEYVVDHFPRQVLVEPLTPTNIAFEAREGA